MSKKIIGYKGFDKDFKCRDFQYEKGKQYTHKGNIKLCDSGFHFCEYPLDIFGYYAPASSRFAKVEADGVTDETSGDSKRVAKKLKITTELKLDSLVKASVKFILDKVDFANAKESNTSDRSAATNTGDQSAATNTGYWSAATNTGNWSAATNTGYRSAATNTGYRSAATNTGDRSAATVEGKDSVAIVTGYNSSASGKKGCWLVLTERLGDKDDYNIKEVRAVKVDGRKIKANKFYKLVNGEVVEL